MKGQQNTNILENEINSIAHLDEFDASGSLRSLASSIDVKVDSIIEAPQKIITDQGQIHQNPFLSDINIQYMRDKDKFLGVWQNDRYQVQRSFLSTKTKNVKLYYTVLSPIFREAIASIVFVHGFGEHSGRYIHLADYFASNGFKTFLYDQRGFGFSGGIRGDASVEEMHEDLEIVILTIDRSLPVFIYCHSLGAAVVLSFCLSNPSLNLQGIICTNAYLRLPGKYSWLKKRILMLLHYFLKDVQINSYINLSQSSKNNYQIRKAAQDPLMWPYLSIKMAYNIMILTEFINYSCQEFNVPIFLIHGKEDKVSHHINSIDFYRLIKSKEKTLKIFQQGYHDLQHDNECDRLKQIVVSWCNKMCLRDRRIGYFKHILQPSFVSQIMGQSILGKTSNQNIPYKLSCCYYKSYFLGSNLFHDLKKKGGFKISYKIINNITFISVYVITFQMNYACNLNIITISIQIT